MEDQPASYRIKDLAENDRPRERMEKLGATFLSTPELLAILLRVGVKGSSAVDVGQSLLKKFKGIQGLHSATFMEICSEKGVGRAKAAQIKAALELGNRLSMEKLGERPLISSAQDVSNLVSYEMSYLAQEELRIILLDTRNRVIKIEVVYKGSANSAQVRIGELFRAAILANATALIVVHNHPSGDPTPSPDDVALTRGIVQAGKMLDIPVLDHIVIGAGKYVSLKERGLGFG